jgi:hypothetical protein
MMVGIRLSYGVVFKVIGGGKDAALESESCRLFG